MRIRILENKQSKHPFEIMYDAHPGMLEQEIKDELEFLENVLDMDSDEVQYVCKPKLVKSVPLNIIKPSQKGNEYINASSKAEAQEYINLVKGLISPNDVRKGNYAPILASRANSYIIDGNHRHAALTMAKFTWAPVLYVTIPKGYLGPKHY